MDHVITTSYANIEYFYSIYTWQYRASFTTITIIFMRFEDIFLQQTTLGQRIRAARAKAYLSQDELSRLVHKDQRAISEIEAGDRKVWASDLPAFARALNVSLAYFFEDELEADDLENELLTAFRQIQNREGKITAIRLLEVLSENPITR